MALVRPPLNGNPRVTCDAACHGYPATDWGADVGTPVYAMHAGIFYRRGPYPDLGKRDPGVCADVEAPGLFSRLAHLSRYALPSGTRVAEGQLVGYSGNSGYSKGPHVHAYIVVNGKRWGALEYLESIGYDWAGDAVAPIITEGETVATLFHLVGSTPTLFALAGSSPGTPANWLETEDLKGLAEPFARIHNAGNGSSSVGLSRDTWNAWKASFLAPLSIAGPPASPSAAPTPDEIVDRLRDRL